MTGVPVTSITPNHAHDCRLLKPNSFKIYIHILDIYTYIDHSIGSDAEEGGSLIDGLDLLPSLHRDLQTLELTQGTLQGRPVLGDQVIACAEVIELADEYLQGALNLASVRLGRWLLVPGVICRGEVRGHIYTIMNKRIIGTRSTSIIK